MSNTDEKNAKKGFGLMHAGMAVCCAVMLIPVAGFFVAGGTLAGLTSNLAVFAPIALCIGVHVAMFAVMGKSCHGEKSPIRRLNRKVRFNRRASRPLHTQNNGVCRRANGHSAALWRLCLLAGRQAGDTLNKVCTGILGCFAGMPNRGR